MSKTDRSIKVISLVGMILSGVLLGYSWQRIADSGQFQFRRIALTCLISVGSYLFAYLLVERRIRAGRTTGWLLAAIIGSLLSAFNVKVVKFVIESAHDPYLPSVSEMIYRVGLGFLFSALAYVVVTIIVLSTMHFLARQLGRWFTSRLS